MSTVIWHTMMSLDGFVAGPDDDMGWVGDFGGRSEVADATRDRIGAIVAGRRWYDLATERWDGRQGIYGGRWDGPVFVVTHHPPAEWDDPGISFVADGVEAAIATAREAAGGRGVGLFGPNTAGQALRAGLVDEIVIHLAPVVLGGGVPLYRGPRVDLSGDVVDVRFQAA